MDDAPEIQVPEIPARQLKDMIASPNPPFTLDVREVWEVSRGAIPGALHIPMNSIPNRLGELPRDRTMVVYCAEGIRSYVVVDFLLRQGFRDVKNLEGGMSAWEYLKYAGR